MDIYKILARFKHRVIGTLQNKVCGVVPTLMAFSQFSQKHAIRLLRPDSFTADRPVRNTNR